MKKLVLFILLLISVAANAQKGISYQAVILDPSKIEIPGADISGQPLVNGNVWVKFAILSGSTSQFEEIQQTKTDAYGLVNLTIGSVASSVFNALTWDANQKTLQVFVSFNDGASYTKVSDQKLTYTPYALFAETAGKLASTLQIAGGGTGATTAVGARANLGLGNVDNTSDASKPISAATQTALDLKASAAMLAAHIAITVDTNMLATKAALTDLNDYAPIASPIFTGSVSGISKSMVGLGFVDNTSDTAKPVSTKTQAALDLKSNTLEVTAALELKANSATIDSLFALKAPLLSPSLTGVPTAPTASPRNNSAQLATTAYTDAAIAVATAGATSGVADNSVTTPKIVNGAVTDAKITAVAASKITGIIPVSIGGTGANTAAAARSNLVLGNVNNTSDLAKPISTLTQVALNLKAPLESPYFTGIMNLNNRAEFGQNIEREQPSLKLIGLSKSGAGVNSFWPTQPYAGGGLEIGDGGAVRLVIYRKSSNTFNISTTGSLNEGLGINADLYDPAYTLDINGTLGVRNSITATGTVEGTGFKIPNGTSSQYLMADGSVSTSGGSSSSSSQSVVDLTTNQTIGGIKTFSSDLSISGKLGVGTATPNSESSVDIATALPLILPKMDQSQISAISAPVASMLQFNTTSKKMQVYKESIGSTSSVFGNTTLSTGATCLRGSGELWFRPTITGTITQIELSAFGAGEVASVVINSNYAGASPSPVLLGTSNSITAVDGWNTWTFATPVPVVANTTYFITSTDANRCLGVRWSNSGDDTTTGNVSSYGFGNPLNSYDPASRITVVVPATNGWVNLRDDVAITNLSTEVTNVLPLANGGTGSSTKNFVDLLSAQTVAGAKSFSGNVVVGATSATGTSAALEVKSTTQGLLLPRLTTTQRDAIAAPLAAGLLIYNSTAGKIQAYTEAEGTAATLANVASSYAGLGVSNDYNVCLSFTPTGNWRVSNLSLGVQSVGTAGNITLSLYSGVPGSGILLGSQTVATSALSAGVLDFIFSTPITVPSGSCYWKASADNTALIFLTRLGQFNDGVNESFTALRNNNTVVVNLPSYSFSFSMPYTPLIGSWNDLH
jgi:hypothetical protein